MKLFILSIALALTLASCEQRRVYVDQYGQQVPQQVIVQQPGYNSYNQPVLVDHSNSGSGFVTGAIVGHMLSGSSHTTVVNHTTVVRQATVPVYNAQRSTSTFRTSPSRMSTSSSSGFRTSGRRR